MTWTTHPAKAGWYWWQPTYSKPRVVEVLPNLLGGRPCVMYEVGSEQPQPILKGIGRWWGPIEPPKE